MGVSRMWQAWLRPINTNRHTHRRRLVHELRNMHSTRAPAAFIGLLALAAFLPAGCALHASAVPVSARASDQTIAQLHDDLAKGHTTVRAVTDYYIGRITTIDSSGPSLRSVLEVNPDAVSIATGLDSARAERGPLFGVPVLLKDNIDTGDRMLTTAGSLALADSKPPRDAFIVRRLRASGAVILGKTNLSEWANFRSTRSSSGWSGRGGQTKNPYALDRNPCGSSSGSGTAIAAGLALVAVGSETDGSIVCPSSANGLVGIKPTLGLVSRSGIIPISASQDTAGPMARTVTDAAALLTVLAGYDPDDPATAPLEERPPVDYTQFLDANSLKGVRIGVMRHFAGFHEKVDAAFEQALEILRAQGAVLIDPADIPTAEKLEADEQIVLQYEFKDGINRYLATRQGMGPRTLTELITYNNEHAAVEMPYFGQEIFIQSNARGPLTDPAYLEARDRAKRLAGPEGIDAALAKDHLDGLIAPTLGPAWTTDLVNGDHFLGGNVSTAPAVAGYPHVTVPMGAVSGLPVGLSFVGTAWSEGRLISYAYAFERATQARRSPEFRASIP
ncbi:MAG: amidase [Gammaproteobacteria bacterium]|nr:amidase [Gammaproteobacteria bacterium]